MSPSRWRLLIGANQTPDLGLVSPEEGKLVRFAGVGRIKTISDKIPSYRSCTVEVLEML